MDLHILRMSDVKMNNLTQKTTGNLLTENKKGLII